MVHPDGVSLRVGVGDEGGDVVQNGHGVQTLGEQAEPLAGHRLVGQESLGSLLKRGCGVEAIFREEVAALGLLTEGTQAVGHRVHQSPVPSSVSSLLRRVVGGSRLKQSQITHGGQRRRAELQQGVLLPPAQGGACWVPAPGGTVEVGDDALRCLDGPGRRVHLFDAFAHRGP